MTSRLIYNRTDLVTFLTYQIQTYATAHPHRNLLALTPDQQLVTNFMQRSHLLSPDLEPYTAHYVLHGCVSKQLLKQAEHWFVVLETLYWMRPTVQLILCIMEARFIIHFNGLAACRPRFNTVSVVPLLDLNRTTIEISYSDTVGL